MLKRLQNRRKGFTLIELLIVIAIIGIIAALLIPNFLDALQKGKQKRTMGDMKDMGTAMFSWVTDQAGAAAAGADVDLGDYDSVSATALASVLVSQYIQDIPSMDGWRNSYGFYLDTADPLGSFTMAIRSTGRDGSVTTDDTYTPGGFEPTDYDQDLVWADGFFVRYPQKTT